MASTQWESDVGNKLAKVLGELKGQAGGFGNPEIGDST